MHVGSCLKQVPVKTGYTVPVSDLCLMLQGCGEWGHGGGEDGHVGGERPTDTSAADRT